MIVRVESGDENVPSESRKEQQPGERAESRDTQGGSGRVSGHLRAQRQWQNHAAQSDRCIDRPTTGRVLIDGVDTSKLNAAQLTALRREKIGFVFQTFNLIPVFTAAENVEFPLLIQGLSSQSGSRRVRSAGQRRPRESRQSSA